MCSSDLVRGEGFAERPAGIGGSQRGFACRSARARFRFGCPCAGGTLLGGGGRVSRWPQGAGGNGAPHLQRIGVLAVGPR